LAALNRYFERLVDLDEWSLKIIASQYIDHGKGEKLSKSRNSPKNTVDTLVVATLVRGILVGDLVGTTQVMIRF